METIIRTFSPLKQKIKVTCRKDREWQTHFVSLYTEESYPGKPEQKPLAEEMTLCFNNKEQVEQFISLIRRATRNIK